MVEVYIDGRASWNQCFVDGSVVSVLAIQLLIPGDVDCTTCVKVERHFLGEGQLTRVTSLELRVSIHTPWSDVVRGQRLIAGQNTANINCS